MTPVAALTPAPTPAPTLELTPARPLRLVPAPDLDVGRSFSATGAPARARTSSAAVAAATQGTLALVFPRTETAPGEPVISLPLRLTTYQRPWADPDERDVPTPRSELPDPRPWCARLVQAAIEAVAGDRPAAQLLRWTSREVYDQICRQAAPTLARATVRRRAATRPVLRSMHAREPLDGVVEACATVIDGGRARAVAIRLEGLGGRWVCTALDVV